MWSRFFWLCSRPLISFGLRHATFLQSPTCTCGKVETNFKCIKHSRVLKHAACRILSRIWNSIAGLIMPESWLSWRCVLRVLRMIPLPIFDTHFAFLLVEALPLSDMHVTCSQFMSLTLWLVRLLTAKARSLNFVWQIMNLVPRVCLWWGRPGLMLGSQWTVWWDKHGIHIYCFRFWLFKRPRDQLLGHCVTRKDGFFFEQCFIQVLNKNPSLRIVDLKKNNITEEGALMLAEAPCGLNGKRDKDFKLPCKAEMQFEVVGSSVRFADAHIPGVVAASRCSEDWAGWQRLGRWSFDLSTCAQMLPGTWRQMDEV